MEVLKKEMIQIVIYNNAFVIGVIETTTKGGKVSITIKNPLQLKMAEVIDNQTKQPMTIPIMEQLCWGLSEDEIRIYGEQFALMQPRQFIANLYNNTWKAIEERRSLVKTASEEDARVEKAKADMKDYIMDKIKTKK